MILFPVSFLNSSAKEDRLAPLEFLMPNLVLIHAEGLLKPWLLRQNVYHRGSQGSHLSRNAAYSVIMTFVY